MISYPTQEHFEIDVNSDVIAFPRRDFNKCKHASVMIDSKTTELVCKHCDAKVNPVLWIKDSMEYFTRLHNNLKEQKYRVKADFDELEKRARTKCSHCNKMTAVNLKNHKFVVLWGFLND